MAARFLRYTNTALLILLVSLTATGLYGLAYVLPAWTFELHRIAAWAVVALAPWKAVIAWRSLRRGPDVRFDRSTMLVVSLVLTLLVGLVLLSGILWTWRLGPQVVWLGEVGDTLIDGHWILGLVLWLPLLAHLIRRWPKPRVSDFTARRSALKSLGLAVAGLAGWQVAEALARWRMDPQAPRTFTGSRLAEPYGGNAMPVTLSLGERELVVDPHTWSLTLVDGQATMTLTYAQLLALPMTELEATLDCTTGWYSPQRWGGILLSDVLSTAYPAGRTVRAVKLMGESGYSTILIGDHVNDLLLATHLGGEPLAPRHGFPVRAVAPRSRGWQWVKWLAKVEVLA